MGGKYSTYDMLLYCKCLLVQNIIKVHFRIEVRTFQAWRIYILLIIQDPHLAKKKHALLNYINFQPRNWDWDFFHKKKMPTVTARETFRNSGIISNYWNLLIDAVLPPADYSQALLFPVMLPLGFIIFFITKILYCIVLHQFQEFG